MNSEEFMRKKLVISFFVCVQLIGFKVMAEDLLVCKSYLPQNGQKVGMCNPNNFSSPMIIEVNLRTLTLSHLDEVIMNRCGWPYPASIITENGKVENIELPPTIVFNLFHQKTDTQPYGELIVDGRNSLYITSVDKKIKMDCEIE